MTPLIKAFDDGHLIFRCPGCGIPHGIQHGTGSGPRWVWNGDLYKPTIQPSVLARWPHWVKEEEKFVNKVCHSFITDGRIRFLDDCTHALAGQTVDLPPMDWGAL